MKIIKYQQDTESNCSPREVYKSSLLLVINFLYNKHQCNTFAQYKDKYIW